MALTITVNQRELMGRLKYRAGTIDFDSSYPAGGEALSAADLELGEVHLALFSPSAGLIYEYDHANAKIKATYPTGGASAPATLTDPAAAVTVPAGATAVTSTAAQPDLTEALTAGRGREVGATTDLSTVTGVRFIAFGR